MLNNPVKHTHNPYTRHYTAYLLNVRTIFNVRSRKDGVYASRGGVVPVSRG